MTEKPRRRRAAKYASHWEWHCKACKEKGGIERVGRVRTQKQYQTIIDAAHEDHEENGSCRAPELTLIKVEGEIG